MTFYGGICGTCIWNYFVDGISNQDWAEYLLSIRRDTDISPVLLTISINSVPPTPSQRKEIAQFIEANPDRMRRVRAAAFVFDSAVTRASLTAIAWIVRKPYPERDFAELSEALTWLSGHSNEFEPSKVMANIAAQVPVRSRS
jgi:hypothetical protein